MSSDGDDTTATREHPSVVIVGGGIGGLCAALGLRRVGWPVTVVERAAAFEPVGAGITLWSNALRCLDELGVGEAVRAAGRPLGNGGLFAPSGASLARGISAQDLTALLSAELVALHREDLHRALRTALPGDCLMANAEVTGVELDESTAAVRLADGRRLAADLVVAADGINSTLRRAVWPTHPGAAYHGTTSWRGVTPEPVAVEMDANETWGRGALFGYLPLGDGRVYWYATAKAPRDTGASPEAEHAELARRFGGWHAPIPALLSATPPARVLRLDLCDLAVNLSSYVSGRVVLLGDAAHAMTPNLGQGAGQAIEDAVVLAACLREATDIDKALAAYDAQRRPRTQLLVARSRQVGRLTQVEGRWATVARSALIRLTPAKAALRGAGRIAAWTPPSLG